MRQLHAGFCRAFESVTGFDGTRRTQRSAQGSWDVGVRFLKFVAERGERPKGWSSIAEATFRAFEEKRRADVKDPYTELRALNTLLAELPEEDALSVESAAWLGRRRGKKTPIGVGGYSDDVFRAIVVAAIQDVRQIVSRLKRGEDLLTGLQNGESMSDEDLLLSKALADAVATGVVLPPSNLANNMQTRLETARLISLTYDDLTPILVLLIAASGRNSESIKELSANHELKQGRVALEIIKRRGGPSSPSDIDLWEVGTGSRELLEPGSLYRIVLGLTKFARDASRTGHLLTVWTNPHRGSRRTRAGGGFHYAWESGLGAAPILLNKWAEKHKIVEAGEPVRLTLNRVRTTTEVRRTRKYGGHTPSAARSNTLGELFRSYLRPDASVEDWKDELIDESFEDAESLIFDSAVSGDNDFGQAPLDKPTEAIIGKGITNTGYLSCRDVLASPLDDGASCTQTALVCFSCGNAVFSEENLPSLVGLKDELAGRHERVSAEEWNRAYATPWSIIVDHILPKFSPDQVELARQHSMERVPLRLLEGRWNDE